MAGILGEVSRDGEALEGFGFHAPDFDGVEGLVLDAIYAL
jgi:hypothetical protein